ncbi:unnamed protein product [Fraxinus pennsylvanica]|uniref:Uncharacterized protein n=1 Tax=Fraxinus pennsylvanica TaxID=56036 RepID=A0AAD1Z553_9LAMI|nr:unnamed protein product [Fraxinus pennsylvanica]
MRSGSSETKFLQELVLYAASAALSCLVLFAGLRHLDPNREASKKAIKHNKDIAKRLGRPLIQTNPYEKRLRLDFEIHVHIENYEQKPSTIFNKTSSFALFDGSVGDDFRHITQNDLSKAA